MSQLDSIGEYVGLEVVQDHEVSSKNAMSPVQPPVLSKSLQVEFEHDEGV